MKIKNKEILILDKYIAKQVLFGLLIVSSILLGIAWFSQIIRLLSYLVNNNLSFTTFLKMTSLLLPDLSTIILPIALFAVILFIYNKLVSDKELIIMHSIGMSIKQLAKPTIVISLILTAICYYLTLTLSPIYARKYRTFIFDSKNDLSALLIKEGEFNQITQGLTIYVKNAHNNILSDIFIHDQRQPRNTRTIIAEQGIITTTPNNISLSLNNGSVQEKNNIKGKYTFGNFGKYTADLGVIATSSTRNLKASELGFFELIYSKDLGYSNEKTYPKFLVELHKRMISPLYNIIFALVALIAILKSSLNKRNDNKNIMFAGIAMIGIQMFYIYFFNFLRVHPQLYPLLYISTIIFIYILFKVLYSEKQINFSKIMKGFKK